MKKIQIFSLVLGAAALVAGAAVYTAAKLAGQNSRHDAESRMLEGPVAPDEVPADEQEVTSEEPEQVEASEEAAESEAPVEAEPEQEEQPEETAEPEQVDEDAAYKAPADEPEQSAEEEPAAAPAAEAEFVDYAAKATEKVQEKAQDVPAPVDLEQYMYINPEKMESLNVVKDSFAAEGVKTDISFTDNTMFFDFVMTDVDDEKTEEALKPDLEAFLKDQTEVYTNIVKQLEEDSGFDDIKMIVIFMDANENEIVSGHYDETGKTM